MEFITDRKEMLEAVKQVSACINSRGSIPILNNVMIELFDESIHITATDLVQRMTAILHVSVIGGGAPFTLPAKKLIALLNTMTNNDIVFDIDNNSHATITSNTASVKLFGMAADDFPTESEIEPVYTIKVSSKELQRVIKNVAYAIDAKGTRKALQGALFDVSATGTLTVVGTDGKRLAVSTTACEVLGTPSQVIVPGTVLPLISNMTGEFITIEFTEKNMRCLNETTAFSTKLIEGNFPNYQQVIPKSFTHSIELDVPEFISKLSLSESILNGNSFVTITLTRDRLSLHAISTDIGETNDEMIISLDIDEPIEICVAPEFLSQALRVVNDENVTLKLSNGVMPMMFEHNDSTIGVVMPLRNG